MRCRAVKRMTEDRRWLGSFQWTPWAPSEVQRGRPPKAREDAEPIRMGAGAPAAAAPAAVAEPSVPITTEASSVEGLHPAPHIHEQMTTSNYGCDIAYNFTHNNIMLEPNAMNNMNTVAYMDVHNTQY